MELADLCFEDLVEELINELGYYWLIWSIINLFFIFYINLTEINQGNESR